MKSELETPWRPMDYADPKKERLWQTVRRLGALGLGVLVLVGVLRFSDAAAALRAGGGAGATEWAYITEPYGDGAAYDADVPPVLDECEWQPETDLHAHSEAHRFHAGDAKWPHDYFFSKASCMVGLMSKVNGFVWTDAQARAPRSTEVPPLPPHLTCTCTCTHSR